MFVEGNPYLFDLGIVDVRELAGGLLEFVFGPVGFYDREAGFVRWVR